MDGLAVEHAWLAAGVAPRYPPFSTGPSAPWQVSRSPDRFTIEVRGSRATTIDGTPFEAVRQARGSRRPRPDENDFDDLVERLSEGRPEYDWDFAVVGGTPNKWFDVELSNPLVVSAGFVTELEKSWRGAVVYPIVWLYSRLGLRMELRDLCRILDEAAQLAAREP